MRVPTTNVFDRIVKCVARIIVLQGSSRSSKTFSVLQYLIGKSLDKPGTRILIARQTLQSLKESILPDLKEILKLHFDMWKDSNLNKADWVYTFENGSVIVFTGLGEKEGEKVHGVKFDYVYINECVDVNYPNVQQLLLRLGDGQLLLDFNPRCSSKFWVYTKILERDDAKLIHSTFRDNPFLNEKNIRELTGLEPTEENIRQGSADETAWKIYGLGQRAQVKGLIFPNYNIVPEFPDKASNLCYGLDWGFTNDPTTLSLKGEYEGELYLQEFLYETGLTNTKNPKNPGQLSIEQRFEEIGAGKHLPMWADSAEPKSIQDIRNCGYDIKGVVKGKGSILDGINTMKRFKINVVAGSDNMISEFENYKWKVTRNGDVTNEPVDKHNHVIDGCRYAVLMSCDVCRTVTGSPYDHIKANSGIDDGDIFSFGSGRSADPDDEDDIDYHLIF